MKKLVFYYKTCLRMMILSCYNYTFIYSEIILTKQSGIASVERSGVQLITNWQIFGISSQANSYWVT